MAFNPAEYTARLQALISGFNTGSNRALYQNQMSNQSARQSIADMNTEYDRQAPRLVAGFGQRGMRTANVKSGAFAKAMQDFSKERVKETSRATGALDTENAFYKSDLAERTAQLNADKKFIEDDKARQIAEDAGQIMRYRAGAYA